MVILVAGFKGGVGKSTIANFLAEKFGGYVLNLDIYQKARENYNSAPTIFVGPDESLRDKIKDSDICVIDAGGFDDARLYDIDVDVFVFPTRTDANSIARTVDSVVTILNRSASKKKKVIFVMNEYQDEEEKKEATEDLMEILQKSEIPADDVYLSFVKRSKAIRRATRHGVGLGELLKSNPAAYRPVNKTFDELVQDIMDAIGEKNEKA